MTICRTEGLGLVDAVTLARVLPLPIDCLPATAGEPNVRC